MGISVYVQKIYFIYAVFSSMMALYFAYQGNSQVFIGMMLLAFMAIQIVYLEVISENVKKRANFDSN